MQQWQEETLIRTHASIGKSWHACRSGKTQIALTMCVTCQMAVNQGGGAGKVGGGCAGWLLGVLLYRKGKGQARGTCESRRGVGAWMVLGSSLERAEGWDHTL